jgi:4-hydroxy-tetrahydrodipicolinate reductase
MPIRIGVNGAGGRMGRRVIALAVADPDMEVTCAIEAPGSPLVGRGIEEIEPAAKAMSAVSTQIVGKVDVVVDFSHPEALEALLEDAASTETPLVVGTTGVPEEGIHRIEKAAKMIPVVHAPNMSLGVNLLFRVTREVAKALGDGFDIEIEESHHNKKADAPSGTAMGLARAVAETLGRDLERDLVHGRSGRPGVRKRREIGMHALRLGGVVGEHTVHFGNEYEVIGLSHRALDRDIFAAGALRAARWVAGRKPGLYDMEDVLFGA